MKLKITIFATLLLTVCMILLSRRDMEKTTPSAQEANPKAVKEISPPTSPEQIEKEISSAKRREARVAAKRSKAQFKELANLIRKGELSDPVHHYLDLLETTNDKFTIAKIQRELGKLYFENADYEMAIEALEGALIEGGLSNAIKFKIMLDLIGVYSEIGDRESAARVIDNAVANYLSPTSPMYTTPDHFPPPDKSYYLFLNTLYNNGFFKEALEYAELAIQYETKYGHKSTILAGKILSSMRRFDKAVELLLSSAKPTPDGKTVHLPNMYSLAIEIRLRQNDIKAAEALYQDALTKISDEKLLNKLKLKTAKLFAARGEDNWRDVLTDVTYSALPGARETALEQLATDAIRSANWETAENYYVALLELPERNPKTIGEDYLKLMNIQKELGKELTYVVDSIASYAENASDQQSQVLYRMGKELGDTGFYDDSIKIFQRLLEFRLGDRWSMYAPISLAEVMSRAGLHEEAAHYYNLYIDNNIQSGDNEKAIHGLVKLGQSVNDGQFKDKPLTQRVRNLIDQSNDADQLLRVAVFLDNVHSMTLARRSAIRAAEVFDTETANYGVPQNGLNVELTIIRRFHELELYEEASTRITKISQKYPDLTGESLSTQLDLMYRTAIDASKGASYSTAEEIYNEILVLSEPDEDLLAQYQVIIGLHRKAYDKEKSLENFRNVAERAPESDFAGIAKLYLAMESITKEKLQDSNKMVDSILATEKPQSPAKWKMRVYWSAQYLKGFLLLQEGNPEGHSLMAQAKEEVKVWHDVEIFCK